MRAMIIWPPADETAPASHCKTAAAAQSHNVAVSVAGADCRWRHCRSSAAKSSGAPAVPSHHCAQVHRHALGIGRLLTFAVALESFRSCHADHWDHMLPSQDSVVAEHRTAVATSYSGRANSSGDEGADTARDSTGQQSTYDAASASGDAAITAAAESRGIAQQSGPDMVPAWEATVAAQAAQPAAGPSAASEEQEQVIGPFEPEAIVSALAGEDPKPQAQVAP